MIQQAGWAQEPTFPVADVQWRVDWSQNACIGGSNHHVYWTNFLEGDTLISDTTYSKVMLLPQCQYINAGSHCPEWYGYPEYGTIVIGGIREDSGKVIFRRFNVPNSFFITYEKGIKNIAVDSEIVIYDINWIVGDSIYYPQKEGDSVLYDVIGMNFHNGKKRFGLQPRNEGAWQVYSAIEGMGGQRGLFSMYYDNINTPTTMCFYSEGNLIYGQNCGNPCQTVSTSMITDESIKIYPNPATQNIFIEANVNDGPFMLRIFNLSGEMVYMDKTFPGNTHIEIQQLNGLYLLSLTDTNGKIRFVKVFIY